MQTALFKRLAYNLSWMLFIIISLSLYYLCFVKPSVEEILANNMENRGEKLSMGGSFVPRYAQDEVIEGIDANEMEIVKYMTHKWDFWVKMNNFVSVGEAYDKCDGPDRISIGRIVLIPDPAGGLSSRTYVNVTLTKTVTSGNIYCIVYYNGKELYQGTYDMCTIEKSWGLDQIIFCPIEAGKHRWIKNFKIPNYLPKGRYELKGWLTNEEDVTYGCLYMIFNL